jgi:hypothetical protein
MNSAYVLVRGLKPLEIALLTCLGFKNWKTRPTALPTYFSERVENTFDKKYNTILWKKDFPRFRHAELDSASDK